ncbi:MAG: DUF1152 domain-containing protein, partial [Candidatus Omnitrophota bacterium]
VIFAYSNILSAIGWFGTYGLPVILNIFLAFCLVRMIIASKTLWSKVALYVISLKEIMFFVPLAWGKIFFFWIKEFKNAQRRELIVENELFENYCQRILSYVKREGLLSEAEYNRWLLVLKDCKWKNSPAIPSSKKAFKIIYQIFYKASFKRPSIGPASIETADRILGFTPHIFGILFNIPSEIAQQLKTKAGDILESELTLALAYDWGAFEIAQEINQAILEYGSLKKAIFSKDKEFEIKIKEINSFAKIKLAPYRFLSCQKSQRDINLTHGQGGPISSSSLKTYQLLLNISLLFVIVTLLSSCNSQFVDCYRNLWQEGWEGALMLHLVGLSAFGIFFWFSTESIFEKIGEKRDINIRNKFIQEFGIKTREEYFLKKHYLYSTEKGQLSVIKSFLRNKKELKKRFVDNNDEVNLSKLEKFLEVFYKNIEGKVSRDIRGTDLDGILMEAVFLYRSGKSFEVVEETEILGRYYVEPYHSCMDANGNPQCGEPYASGCPGSGYWAERLGNSYLIIEEDKNNIDKISSSAIVLFLNSLDASSVSFYPLMIGVAVFFGLLVALASGAAKTSSKSDTEGSATDKAIGSNEQKTSSSLASSNISLNIAKSKGVRFHRDVNETIKSGRKEWVYGKQQISLEGDMPYRDVRLEESTYIEHALNFIASVDVNLARFAQDELNIVLVDPRSSVSFLFCFFDKEHYQVVHAGLSRHAIYLPKGLYQSLKNDPQMLAAILVHDVYEVRGWISAYTDETEFFGGISSFRDSRNNLFDMLHKRAERLENKIVPTSVTDSYINGLIDAYYKRSGYQQPSPAIAQFIDLIYQHNKGLFEKYLSNVLNISKIEIRKILDINYGGEGALKYVYRIAFATNMNYQVLGLRFIKKNELRQDVSNEGVSRREVAYFNNLHTLDADIALQIREYYSIDTFVAQLQGTVKDSALAYIREYQIIGCTFGEFLHGFTLDNVNPEDKIYVYRKNVSLLAKTWLRTLRINKEFKDGKGMIIDDPKPQNFIYSYRHDGVFFIDLDQAIDATIHQFGIRLLAYLCDFSKFPAGLEFVDPKNHSLKNENNIREVLVQGFVDGMGAEKTKEFFEHFQRTVKSKTPEYKIAAFVLNELDEKKVSSSAIKASAAASSDFSKAFYMNAQLHKVLLENEYDEIHIVAAGGGGDVLGATFLAREIALFRRKNGKRKTKTSVITTNLKRGEENPDGGPTPICNMGIMHKYTGEITPLPLANHAMHFYRIEQSNIVSLVRVDKYGHQIEIVIKEGAIVSSMKRWNIDLILVDVGVGFKALSASYHRFIGNKKVLVIGLDMGGDIFARYPYPIIKGRQGNKRNHPEKYIKSPITDTIMLKTLCSLKAQYKHDVVLGVSASGGDGELGQTL